MKTQLVFLLFFLPIIGLGQSNLGTELYLELNIYEFGNDTSFICNFFRNETRYKSVNQSYKNYTQITDPKIRVCSVGKNLDTSWFSKEKDLFVQRLFDRDNTLLVILNGKIINIPKIISEKTSTYSIINLYSSSGIIKNPLDLISLVRTSDVIKPKKNYIFNKGKEKPINDCSNFQQKRVKLIFELENKFSGSN